MPSRTVTILWILVAGYFGALAAAVWIRRSAERETEKLIAAGSQTDIRLVYVSTPPDIGEHVGHDVRAHYDATSALSTAIVKCSCGDSWEVPVAEIRSGA